ncbi:unnamed protein product [Miscanthus lutarioriparius]|uniref:UDP-glycosyltransferases domain-containing protein n=1 Tax=Miscanthus lutarioriparius TaxID=422564 RepID=A0A811QJ51_9POAL|nr:unnamed protein product [Miscanthus lutarioriparius]
MLTYLQLAERLASRGHRVSYVSMPRNLARLPPRRHAVDLVALQLPQVQGLPEGAESTNDVPGDRLEPLWEAFDVLAAPFAEFLSAACADEVNRRLDWVMVDTLHDWAPSVPAAHKVPCAMLQPSAATIAAWACGARDRAQLAAASIFEQLTTVEEPPAGVPRHEWDGERRCSHLWAGQERTHGLGMVTTSWVPQNTILAQGAVGAFLTHCGRNSLTEGLLYGHPLIMLPIFADQGPNARLMAGRKLY